MKKDETQDTKCFIFFSIFLYIDILVASQAYFVVWQIMIHKPKWLFNDFHIIVTTSKMHRRNMDTGVFVTSEIFVFWGCNPPLKIKNDNLDLFNIIHLTNLKTLNVGKKSFCGRFLKI